MRRNFYTIRNLIGHRHLCKKYNLTRAELFDLIAQKKLKPLHKATIFFNSAKVATYFESQEHQDSSPLTISGRDLIAKYGLSRTAFAALIHHGHLVPLPLKHTKNLFFEYDAVKELFGDAEKANNQ